MVIAGSLRVEHPIDSIEARAYRIPTQEAFESDGTFEWDATTMVLVEIRAGGTSGVGYTYADASAATMINGMLREGLIGRDAMQIAARNHELYAKIRNNGRSGITSMAISAIDIALWDLKGKVLQTPVCALLGIARSRVPVYGSGGFTSLDIKGLTAQLGSWVQGQKIPCVKMKVGRDPANDPARVAAARKAIGKDAQLFVDANGAYTPKQALDLADPFHESDVSWYEEPVYHNDLRGNRFVRERAPAAMEISNGEYGFAPYEFLRIIEERAADVLQADVTRCGGISGFLAVDGLCQAHAVPLSSHCAPYATLHAALVAKTVRHVEFFSDHVRIEQMFFDGAAQPVDGELAPDLDRPGLGLEVKWGELGRFLL